MSIHRKSLIQDCVLQGQFVPVLTLLGDYACSLVMCYVLCVMCYVLCVMCYVLCYVLSVMCYVLCVVMCYVLCGWVAVYIPTSVSWAASVLIPRAVHTYKSSELVKGQHPLKRTCEYWQNWAKSFAGQTVIRLPLMLCAVAYLC